MIAAHFAQLAQCVGQTCGRCGRQAQRSHPVAQQIQRAIVVECEQRRFRQCASFVVRSSSHVDARHFIEQPLRRGCMCSRARQRIAKAGKVHSQLRQHVTPQCIARVTGVAIRFIVDPAQMANARVVVELRAQQMQQRTHTRRRRACRPMLARHRGKPGEPRPAQQLQQHTFRPDRPHAARATTRARARRRTTHRARDNSASRAAASTLSPRRARNVDVSIRERNPQLPCERLAMREPCVGIRTETVVNMKGDTTRRPRDTHRRIEQHRRIESTAQCNGDSRIRGQRGKTPRRPRREQHDRRRDQRRRSRLEGA